MTTMNRTVPALLAAALLSATAAQAADKTYLVNRSFETGSVTGTIVTTGQYGAFEGDDGIVTGWALHLVSGDLSFDLTPQNSYLFGTGWLTATPLELSYDFSAQSYFGFFHAGADAARWCLQTSVGQCTFAGAGGETVAITQGSRVEQFQSLTGTHTIAVSSVPEPATDALWVAGLGLLGAALRRRTGA
jgi:hypothetical protein